MPTPQKTLLHDIRNVLGTQLDLLAPEGTINSKLFIYWCQTNVSKYTFSKDTYQLVLNIMEWTLADMTAVEQDAAFSWMFAIYSKTPRNKNNTIKDLKQLAERYPEPFQLLLEHYNFQLNLINLGFAVSIVPNPTQWFEAHTAFKQWLSHDKPLAFAQRISNTGFREEMVSPYVVKTLHSMLSSEEFERWQFGAWSEGLPSNMGQYQTKKYATTYMLEAIYSEPYRQTSGTQLAKWTLQRYKGKDLVGDMFKAVETIITKNEDLGTPQDMTYYASFLIPALEAGLRLGMNTEYEANAIDKSLVTLLHAGVINAMDPVSCQWLDARIVKDTFAPKSTQLFNLGTHYKWLPSSTQDYILTSYDKQYAPDGIVTPEAILSFLTQHHYSPPLVNTIINRLSEEQWEALQQNLDDVTPAKTIAILNLLVVNQNPRLHAYRTTMRARIALIATCTRLYKGDDRILGQIPNPFEASSSIITPVLTQPMSFFAHVFPEYKSQWINMLDTFLTESPPTVVHGRVVTSSVNTNLLKIAVDNIGQVLLGQPLPLQHILNTSDSLGLDMSLEEIISTSIKPEETFVLPQNFEM